MKFPAPPLRTPLADPKTESGMSRPWLQWFNQVQVQLSTAGTVTGAKGGNAALASLITVLAQKGIITDSTTP